MAVTIKLKNASGSDPSASDLVLGELAVRTDNGKIFLKKDNGTVAEVSGGGIDDGDKGDITVSNSGATWSLDSGVVTTAIINNGAVNASKILDNVVSEAKLNVSNSPTNGYFLSAQSGNTGGLTWAAVDLTALSASNLTSGTIPAARIGDDSIVNAKINSSAAIAGSKISPNFTSAMDVDGSITCDDIITAGALLHEGDTNTLVHFTANDEISLKTNGSIRFQAHNYGVSVTGNIGVSGTVDGVDIAALNTAHNSISTSNGSILDGVVAITQSAGDNSTKIATTAYTDTAISNLINGAPAALDTLNELAAAMADDAAFSTTVTNSLATKLPLAGGQITGNITCSGSQTFDGRDLSTDGSKLDGIESGATADQSASEILTLIKTVDGAGSGLDADTCDGQHLGTSSDVQFGSVKTGGNAFKLDSYNTNDLRIQGTGATGAQGILGTDSAGTFKYQLYGTGSYVGFLDGAWANWDLRKQLGGQLDLDVGGNLYTVYHGGNLTVGDGGLTQNNFTNTLKSKLDGIASSATNVTNNNQLTNGAGYITSSNAAITNKLPLAGGTLTGHLLMGDDLKIKIGAGGGDLELYHQSSNNHSYIKEAGSGSLIVLADDFYIQDTSTNTMLSAIEGGAVTLHHNSNARFATSNDGATLTGRLTPATTNDYGLGSASLRWANFYAVTGNFSGNITASGTVDGRDLASDGSKLDGIESGATADQSASEILTLIKTVDGSGSGLDADLLDGSTGADYLNYNNFTNTPTIPTNNNQLTNGAGYLTSASANDGIFWENNQNVTSNYTITNGKNAMTAGPITIDSGVTVTIGSGEYWTIL